MVTGASLRPSAISGSSPGCMISAIDGFSMTSRRPTALAGCSLKGLKPRRVRRGAGLQAPPSSPARRSTRLPSVGPSPVHPARAATIAIAASWRRPGNTPSVLQLFRIGAKAFSKSSSDAPVELLAVDEEGRRRAHPERVGAARAHGGDVVEQLLVGQALVEALLGEARLLGELEELRPRVALARRPSRPAWRTAPRSAGRSSRRRRSAPAWRRPPPGCRAGTRAR